MLAPDVAAVSVGSGVWESVHLIDSNRVKLTEYAKFRSDVRACADDKTKPDFRNLALHRI